MKLLSYAAAALVLMANVAAAQFGPLVSPAELNASLGTNAPVILDIRAPAILALGSGQAASGAHCAAAPRS